MVGFSPDSDPVRGSCVPTGEGSSGRWREQRPDRRDPPAGGGFPGLLLVGAEIALRSLGLGETELSRLPYQKVYLPVMQDGVRRDGVAVLRTGDVRLPYQSILAEKPKDGLRVFVFGASATYGLGFSTNASFAAQLGHILRAAHPDRTVEVVNFGIVAIPAKSVRLLVEDTTRRYHPDLVVIYSGNNEFMEIHAEKYMEAEATPLSRLRSRIAGLRIARVVNQALRGDEIPTLDEQDASKADVRDAERTIIHEITITDDEIGQILDRYEGTLAEMVEAARQSDASVVLMTVASNWRWRGLRDLPEDWMDEWTEGTTGSDRELQLAVIEKLDAALDAGPAKPEEQELLYKRGVATR